MLTEKQITDREDAKLEEWRLRNTKRITMYTIETYNDPAYGWECEGWHATLSSAMSERKAYVENASCPVRIRGRRIKREEVFKTDPES